MFLAFPGAVQRPFLLPGIHGPVSRLRPDPGAVRPAQHRLGRDHRPGRGALGRAGRRSAERLLVATALLMVVEMALLAFVPLGDGRVIFLVFLANRVLSGLAEALASGADEALAYDTLVAHDLAPVAAGAGLADARPERRLHRRHDAGAVYDHRLLNRVLAWFGLEGSVHPELSMRLPIYRPIRPPGPGGGAAPARTADQAAPVGTRPAMAAAGRGHPAHPAGGRLDPAHALCPGGDPVRHDAGPRAPPGGHPDQRVLSADRRPRRASASSARRWRCSACSCRGWPAG